MIQNDQNDQSDQIHPNYIKLNMSIPFPAASYTFQSFGWKADPDVGSWHFHLEVRPPRPMFIFHHIFPTQKDSKKGYMFAAPHLKPICG